LYLYPAEGIFHHGGEVGDQAIYSMDAYCQKHTSFWKWMWWEYGKKCIIHYQGYINEWGGEGNKAHTFILVVPLSNARLFPTPLGHIKSLTSLIFDLYRPY